MIAEGDAPLDAATSRRLARAAIFTAKAEAARIEAVTANLQRIAPQLARRAVDHSARAYFEGVAEQADADAQALRDGAYRPAPVFARAVLASDDRVALLAAHARLELAVAQRSEVVGRLRMRNPRLYTLDALRRL